MKKKISENRILQKAVLLLFCTALFAALFSVPAVALNSDYMNPEKWTNNQKVTTVCFEGTAAGNTVKGYFSYVTDSKLGVYTYFRITETSLSESANNVTVTYEFRTEDDNYPVTVDKDGVYNVSNEQGKSMFVAESSFSLGNYISGAQFTGSGYSQCYVDVTLSVNGHNYNITKNKKIYGQNIFLEIPTTEKTTKPTTVKTTAKKEKKTTAVKQSKTKAKTTAKAKTTRPKKETTTKFKPRYVVTTTAAQKQSVQSKSKAAADSENGKSPSAYIKPETVIVTEIPSGESETYVINPTVKKYLPLFIILVTAGVAALIIGAAKSKKEDAETEEAK